MLLASDTLIHFICKSRCLRRKVSGPRVGSIPASNSKRSETEIIYLSTVKIRWTAKLRLQKSSVQYWKWWLCESSRSYLQLLLGLRNIWYGCHSRFLSASEASEPPISHISTSPSARGDVRSDENELQGKFLAACFASRVQHRLPMCVQTYSCSESFIHFVYIEAIFLAKI